MGNNDFHHFVCPKCGNDTGIVSDTMITQKELDEQYKLEKAKIISLK